jgi:hypothetical protein
MIYLFSKGVIVDVSLSLVAENPESTKQPIWRYRVDFDVQELENTDVIDCGTVTFAKMDATDQQRVIFHQNRYWRQEEINPQHGRTSDLSQVLRFVRGNPARTINRLNPSYVIDPYDPDGGKPIHELGVDERERLAAGVARIRADVIVVDGMPFIACDEPLLEVRLSDGRINVQPTLSSSAIGANTVLFSLDKRNDACEFAEKLAAQHGGLPVVSIGDGTAFRHMEPSSFNEVSNAIKRLRHVIDACAPMLLAAGLSDKNTSQLMAFRSNIGPLSLDLMVEAEELCAGLEGDKAKPEVAMFLQKVSTIRLQNAFLSNQLDDKPALAMGG